MSQDYIEKNFETIKEKANVAEQRTDDNPVMERLILCSKNFKQDCIQNDIPYIEISRNFDIELITREYKSIYLTR